MNLFQFLKETDLITNSLSKKELEGFVHNLARVLPQKNRDEFLHQLRGYCNLVESKSGKQADLDKPRGDKIRKEAKIIIDKLQDVDDGVLCLESEVNEEYDDWYGGDNEENEFVFSDPEHVLDTLNKAAQILHRCVDVEEYKAGYELAEVLFSLTVTVNGDYSDFMDETMNLAELAGEDLLEFDINKLLVEGLCAAWHVLPGKERAKVFWEMISCYNWGDFTLERVFQSGVSELEGKNEFLREWIWYLGAVPGTLSKKLLKEAFTLDDNPTQALGAARQFYKTHPELYEILLQKDLIKGGDELRFTVGQEALQILEKGEVRASIALLTAEAALRQNKVEEAQICWLEAYLSNQSSVNYLRLAVESQNFSGYSQRISAAKEGETAQIRFLKGDFQKVVDLDMNVKNALGWSSTFMKTGIALFLLYLYGDTEAKQLPNGCKKMLEYSVFDLHVTSREYQKGLRSDVETDAENLFWRCFCKWRQQTPMAVEFQEKILQRIEELLWWRTDGIMEANRRKYYGECAAFVAALGETLEMRGKIGAKQKMLESFRSRWPRRVAFREELRRFGYRG